jgi:hypothetical protein
MARLRDTNKDVPSSLAGHSGHRARVTSNHLRTWIRKSLTAVLSDTAVRRVPYALASVAGVLVSPERYPQGKAGDYRKTTCIYYRKGGEFHPWWDPKTGRVSPK